MFNQSVFQCQHCGGCCFNVPVMDWQLEEIKEAIRGLDPAYVQRVRSQKRAPGFCPLMDVDKKSCIVYKVRPGVCRQYGYFKTLECRNNPGFKVSPEENGHDEYKLFYVKEGEVFAGVLGNSIKWKELIK